MTPEALRRTVEHPKEFGVVGVQSWSVVTSGLQPDTEVVRD